MVLVSLISNVFTNKNSLANKWMSFSSSNLALFCKTFFYNIKLKDTSIFSLFRWFGTGQKKYWACTSEKCCLFQINLLWNFIESYFENVQTSKMKKRISMQPMCCLKTKNVWFVAWLTKPKQQTTDTQWEDRHYCMVENLIPIPNC